jgi:hypothetical protein
MNGYGVQVMANPAIHAFQHVAGILPEDYPAQSKRVFAEGNKILTDAFNLKEDDIPAWMFRTGKSSPLPVEMKTLRRPLSQVVRADSVNKRGLTESPIADEPERQVDFVASESGSIR